MLNRNTIETFADATITGREDDPTLDRPVDIRMGRDVFETRWQSWWPGHRATARDLFRALAHHPEQEKKDGRFWFFGALVPARKRAENVRSIDLLLGDFDDATNDLETGLAIQRELDLTSVLWTSHSHRPNHHKFRLAFLLDRPWCVDRDEPLHVRKARWRAAYLKVIDPLPLVHDVAGERLNQGFYLPAHRPGAPYVVNVHIGTPLVLPEVDPADLPTRGAMREGVRREGIAVADPTMRDEWKWFLRAHGDRFMAADFMEAIGWPIVAHGGHKVAIECPNRHAHSDPDDPADTGCCAFNAGSPDGRGVVCLHAHCADMTTGDALAMICDGIDGDPIDIAYEYVRS